MIWSADFETTTISDDCRVWAWAICNVNDLEDIRYGNSIESFLEELENQHQNPTCYFHNAKFDFQFIISWLLNNGYTWIDDKKDRADKTFTALITDNSQYYSLEIYFKVYSKRVKKATFRDSLKLLNFSVKQIAKNFGLEFQKLDLDYETFREKGHRLTDHELKYITHDVKIVAAALSSLFERGLTKMTISSNAFSNFKETCDNFNSLFPVLPLEVDQDIRQSYKGGFTYLSPLYREKETGGGVVFDTNSMYPSKMKAMPMPVGEPVYFEGQYQSDPVHPLYVQKITCAFDIKPGKIPSIQIKNSLYFQMNEYIESSNDDLVTLYLTSVDLELFFKQYDVYDIEYQGGWKFRSIQGVFDKYIDTWMESKIKSKAEGNFALTQISKLMLNSCYGKLGINPISGRKRPYLDKDGVVRYQNIGREERKSIYVAAASFITSYARSEIILSSQTIRDWSLKTKGYDAYVYSDTDSIHCLIDKDDVKELSKFMRIDDYELGAWKLESTFIRGKYLRQKCYIEQDEDGVIHSTIAGLPKSLAPLINFENFEIGFTIDDLDEKMVQELGTKLGYQYVPGGVILKPVPFRIK